MRQILYKKGKKQLVGDGYYIRMSQDDYNELVDMFMTIGDVMSRQYDPDTQARFNRYLDKPITYGNKGTQTRRDFILGIIKQKGIEQKDFSTRQLEDVAEIYNHFAPWLALDPIEFEDEDILMQVRADRYNRIFTQVSK